MAHRGSSLDFGPADSFTLAAWVRPTFPVLDGESPPHATVISLTYSCTNETIFLAVLGDGTGLFLVRDRNGIAEGVHSGGAGTVVGGVWQHPAAVRDVRSDGIRLRFYLNGVKRLRRMVPPRARSRARIPSPRNRIESEPSNKRARPSDSSGATSTTFGCIGGR